MLLTQKYTVVFVALLSVYARARATANDESFTSVNYQEVKHSSMDIGSHGHMKHQPTVSCRQMKTKDPARGTGTYYTMFKGQYIPVFCNMGVLCDSNDGWTRIAHLNMNDKTQSCPPGFYQFTAGTKRACGRRQNAGAGICQSAYFSSMGIKYSQLCGRIYGYQYKSPDGVFNGNNYTQDRIDAAYVDGISVTHGYPRTHIWTFVAGYSENKAKSTSNCPCTTSSKQKIQSFVGKHHFCESGNTKTSGVTGMITNDPLWDGKNCRTDEANCCKVQGIPRFYRDLGGLTDDDIEVRTCADQAQSDEDVPIYFVEIYVK